MLLIFLSAATAWGFALLFAEPAGWPEEYFLAAWIVLIPFIWVIFRVTAFVAALRVSEHLAKADQYAEAMRLRRARGHLLLARAMAEIGVLAKTRIELRSMVHSRTIRLMERLGNWESVLKAAGRLNRSSRRPEDKIVAYNAMLRGLAMLGRREAFAAVFGALEAVFAVDAGKYGNKTPKEREEDLSIYQPLAKANYLRGLLGYRDGDLTDARHWLRRARRLDPEDLEPLTLLLEIAGWEEDEPTAEKLLKETWKLAAQPSERSEKIFAKLRDILARQREEQASDKSAPEEQEAANERALSLETEMQRAFAQGAENGRWRAAWAEIKLQALLRQPDKIESLLAQYGEIAERFPRGRVEVRLAKMLLAALRREGNAMEAPYAEVRHLIRQSLIPADLMEEIPIWRAMALIYRGQFQAALEKFDEIRASVSAEGVARVPTLYRLLADAYSAHCYQRLGQSKEATPLRESARQLAPKKSKLAILKLGPKARLEAKKKEDFSQSRQDAKKKERKEGSKG